MKCKLNDKKILMNYMFLGKLEPQRDKNENGEIYNDDYKLFDIGKELIFQCKPTSGDGKGIVW